MGQSHGPYPSWAAVLEARRSRFFSGHSSDTVFDRSIAGSLTPYFESLFTQSNARVLIGQASNGSFRLIALPTQVYPAPTGFSEFGLGPGMYHHFDVVMYAGDLSYQIAMDGAQTVDLVADERDNETTYLDEFLPLTHTQVDDLDVTLISLAPVAHNAQTAALAPAPLPGLPGALYVLCLRNTGATFRRGKVTLKANDLLVGHYEDAAPAMRALNRPSINLRQRTLILSRPEGSVGIHLHSGTWTRLEPPFQAERSFALAPGEEVVIETHIGIGVAFGDVVPTIYALHLRPALEWLNLTAAFWHSRLGHLKVDANDAAEEAQLSRDIYIRSLLDNFNCLQTDASGALIAHWQGAPSHGYGTIWGIDVEPTAASIVHICPELTRQAMIFFMTRSRAPIGTPEHSTSILVAPIILARKWLEVTGDITWLEEHPDVLTALQGIMDHLLTLQAPGEALFPSRYSSDGPVGRRYDYGTNVKVWYALVSFAYILRCLGCPQEAGKYLAIAEGVRSAINRTMITEGPFGRQISGGTNLGEDPGAFYLPEGQPYYDGEDTSSMLAPIYGLCDFTDEAWVNYHRFARSLWCANFDPEFETLRWGPGEFGVLDGTALFSRVGGSVTRAEMREAFQILHRVGVDDVTGSVFWWPRGLDYKRGLTRCSQGQGAWAWQYLQQWLGVHIDAFTHTLTLAPRGLLTQIEWQNLAIGLFSFDIHWIEDGSGATASVHNHNNERWTVQVGFRRPRTGAEGPLTWQTIQVEPGATATLSCTLPASPPRTGMDRSAIAQMEANALGDTEGVIFARFGPATLWGHWNTDLWWDPQAMPLALRLVIVNGTGVNWKEVTVEVTYPEGWLGCARQAQLWTRPDSWSPHSCHSDLGALPNRARAVAAFWLRGPHTYTLGKAWESTTTPFHAPSQPGNGLTLSSPEVNALLEATFNARLRAITTAGTEVQRSLTIPVRIFPDERFS